MARPADDDAASVLLRVRVTPRAARERVELIDDHDGRAARVWVTAPPSDGAANAATLGALARALGVPRSALRIVRGEAARDKLVSVSRP